MERFRDLNVFDKVTAFAIAGDQVADAKLHVIITQFRGMSQAMTIFGRHAFIVADVEIIDGHSAETIGSASVEGKSSSTGTTLQAVQRTADEIVAFAMRR